MSLPAPIVVAPHVADALSRGTPVVALESTVLTHGLPRPRNLELARRMENLVRDQGAVPATVGVIAGHVVVGLAADQLERLSTGEAEKASTWNLAALAAAGADAGTTVATTLYAAHAAGIEVFATGGIGGVHDTAFDESADLPALARYPVLTVCAGPKSILDATATLERLETLGVPVVGYRSDRLAGFVVPTVDLALPSRVDDPAAAAAVLLAQRALGLPGGVLVSNPVSDGIDVGGFARLLAEARADAQRDGVRGRDTTPYLLERLAVHSQGRTVDVNLRLLEENAILAGRIAVAIARTRSAEPDVEHALNHGDAGNDGATGVTAAARTVERTA
ncbi:MAG: pseudouridine-5'-phosphate glycosidase [Trueperaceae bacterium]